MQKLLKFLSKLKRKIGDECDFVIYAKGNIISIRTYFNNSKDSAYQFDWSEQELKQMTVSKEYAKKELDYFTGHVKKLKENL